VYSGLALGALDYRARYGMDHNSVLEAVLPYWVVENIRADWAFRNDAEPDQLSDAEIVAQFTALNIRPQFVNDWQVRAGGLPGNPGGAITGFPATATALLYAAGTWVQGNGLQLDLGVVRDSALNATNDHTAAWTEECHLVAKVGHESAQYTLDTSVTGASGAQV
jgi:hypothetical protein